MARFVAHDVIVRRPPLRWPIALAAVGVPVFSAALDNIGLTAAIVMVEAIVFLMWPALAANTRAPGERKVREVAGDAKGVSFGNRLALRREKIDGAATEALADGRYVVQLWGRRSRDDLAVTLPNVEQADQLIEALGLTADRHAASFTVDAAPLRAAGMRRLMTALRLAGAAAILAFVCAETLKHDLFGLTLVPFMFMYFAIVKFLRFRRRVTLGTDALVVDEPIGMSEITKVGGEGQPGSVVIERRTGAPLKLTFETSKKCGAFASRLSKSLGKGTADIAHVTSLVAPDTRSREAWLDGLRKLGAASFRGASVPTEDLWRIVEHPAADSGARAGAVAALVPHLDEPARVRIGELADATAHADLRAALKAATAEDATDEAVLEAYMGEQK